MDFLRGVFAILVVFAHATAVVQEYHGAEAAATPLGRLLGVTLRQGLVWVIGFFVISGFCIQHSTAAAMLSSGRIDLGRYARARVSRIFPFYLIGLAFALTAMALRTRPDVNLPKTIIALTMTQGALGCIPSFENSWSLTNEMFYYVVYGVLLWRWRGGMKSLFIGGAVLSLGMTAACLIAWIALGKPVPGVFAFWTIPLQMLIWLGGAALVHYWRPLSAAATPVRGLWPALALSFVVVYFFYTRLWEGGVRLVEMELVNLAWLPFFCLLLLSLGHMAWLERPGVRTAAAKLGLSSYPLYLLHSPLQDMLRSLLHPLQWFGQMPPVMQWSIHVIVPVAFCLTLGVPVEQRLLAWRKQWLKKTGPACA